MTTGDDDDVYKTTGEQIQEFAAITEDHNVSLTAIRYDKDVYTTVGDFDAFTVFTFFENGSYHCSFRILSVSD